MADVLPPWCRHCSRPVTAFALQCLPGRLCGCAVFHDSRGYGALNGVPSRGAPAPDARTASVVRLDVAVHRVLTQEVPRHARDSVSRKGWFVTQGVTNPLGSTLARSRRPGRVASVLSRRPRASLPEAEYPGCDREVGAQAPPHAAARGSCSRSPRAGSASGPGAAIHGIACRAWERLSRMG